MLENDGVAGVAEKSFPRGMTNPKVHPVVFMVPDSGTGDPKLKRFIFNVGYGCRAVGFPWGYGF